MAVLQLASLVLLLASLSAPGCALHTHPHIRCAASVFTELPPSHCLQASSTPQLWPGPTCTCVRTGRTGGTLAVCGRTFQCT